MTGSMHNNLAYSSMKNSYQHTYQDNDLGKPGGSLWSPRNVKLNGKYATDVNCVFDQVLMVVVVTTCQNKVINVLLT